MKAKWSLASFSEGLKLEWKGYVIVSKNEVYRWWVIQGQPAPSRNKFEYLNDAKEACETAYRMEAR